MTDGAWRVLAAFCPAWHFICPNFYARMKLGLFYILLNYGIVLNPRNNKNMPLFDSVEKLHEIIS